MKVKDRNGKLYSAEILLGSFAKTVQIAIHKEEAIYEIITPFDLGNKFIIEEATEEEKQLLKDSDLSGTVNNGILYAFYRYSKDTVPVLIKNCETILDTFPHDLKDDVLTFLVFHALNGIICAMVNETYQIMMMLHKTDQIKADVDLNDLWTIRDKIVMHGLQDMAKDRKKNLNIQGWFANNYGEHKKTYRLIDRVQQKLRDKIDIDVIRIQGGMGSVIRNEVLITQEEILKLIKRSHENPSA